MKGTKFYRKNEAEVMRELGLKPTKGSGAGWVEKADGQSEDIICELKSTNANSIRVRKEDLDKLKHQAMVTYKLPIFAIQFINSGDVYLLVKPGDVEEIAKYLDTGKYIKPPKGLIDLDLSSHENISANEDVVVQSSKSAREKFMEEHEKKFRREKSAR